MRGTLPVAVCFNSVNVLLEDGSIKILQLDTCKHILTKANDLSIFLNWPSALAAVKHFTIKLMLKVIAWLNSQKQFNPYAKLVLAFKLMLHRPHHILLL